ncbi:MAG: TraR/DksA C4-type zinc finger protein [Planctomycetes bacterium]|nr:TraR/DksA C4-type zinc finger protein [Planctomycetota bacterium]
MAKDSKKPAAKSPAKPASKVAKPAAKPAPKADAKKPAAKPSAKPAAKPAKPVAKPAGKPVAKPAVKAPVAKVEVKKGAAKPPVKEAPKPGKPAGKTEKAPAPSAKTAPAPAKPETGPGSGRKGITVVDKQPVKKPKPVKPSAVDELASLAGQLLRPGGPAPKPLIASGSKAPSTRPLGSQLEYAEKEVNRASSPFNKTELKHYRDILLAKRAEILADVSSMEKQALEGGSGSLSHQPQHIAEQGSDTYDQTLALSIAEADRKTIKEIDDALQRIDDGTYGVCEVSGKVISKTRLEELPWARLTIEAARERDRRMVNVPRQPPPSYYS